MTASPAGSRIGQPRPWRDEERAALREWGQYERANARANAEYDRILERVEYRPMERLLMREETLARRRAEARERDRRKRLSPEFRAREAARQRAWRARQRELAVAV